MKGLRVISKIEIQKIGYKYSRMRGLNVLQKIDSNLGFLLTIALKGSELIFFEQKN